MFKHFCATAALAIITTSAWSQSFDIKGIRLGTPKSQLGDNIANFFCTRTRADLPFGCGHERPFGDTTGYVAVLFDDNEQDMRVIAVSVIFAEEEFGSIANALTEKFGAPTSKSKESVSNRMGAKFDNAMFVWLAKDGETLRLQQRAGEVSKSIVELQGRAYVEYMAHKAKTSAKDSASKL